MIDPRDGDGDGFISGPDGKDNVPSSGGAAVAEHPLKGKLSDLQRRAAVEEMSASEAAAFRADAESLRKEAAATKPDAKPGTPKEQNQQGHSLTSGAPDAESSAAMKEYQGGFLEVNAFLRGEEEDPTGEIGNTVSSLDTVLSKSRTEKDITVFRGQELTPEQVGQLKSIAAEGGTYRDAAFLSTSVSREVAEDFIPNRKSAVGALFEIETPKGSSGAYVNKFTGLDENHPMGGELEFLMPRNQSLSVVSVANDAKVKGRLHIKLRVNG